MALAEAHGVTEFQRVVYQQLATYCFGEAVCWPSQDLLARDLGCSRLSVNRAVSGLERAGWLAKLARRWSPRSGWMHNRYELLEPWQPISRWVAEHIVRRSERRRWGRFAARYEAVNTNSVGGNIAFPPNPAPSRADKLHDSLLGVLETPERQRERRRVRPKRQRRRWKA